MSTIAEQLTSLANTKTAIKDAIEAKGVSVSDSTPFSAYPSKIGEISGGGAPAERFGVSIDDVFGTVDDSGNYQTPTSPYEVNIVANNVPSYVFTGRFARSGVTKSYLKFNTLDKTRALAYGFFAAYSHKEAVLDVPVISGSNVCFGTYFDNIELEEITLTAEEISGTDTCPMMYAECPNLRVANIPYLTQVLGDNACQQMFEGCDVLQEMPLQMLEEVVGVQAFFGAFRYTKNICSARFDHLTAISGKNVFGAMFAYSEGLQDVYFPSLVTVTTSTAFGSSAANLIFANCDNLTEIHFREDAQELIEGLSGYSLKFGATNATIYFDL